MAAGSHINRFDFPDFLNQERTVRKFPGLLVSFNRFRLSKNIMETMAGSVLVGSDP